MSVRNMMARHTKNVLSQQVDVPRWWSGKMLPHTRTEQPTEDTMDSDVPTGGRSRSMVTQTL